MSAQPRYAVYYTPSVDHPLTKAAASWLGRDAFGSDTVSGDAASRRLLVAEPRRYGFHATLKAPFRLAKGAKIGQLETALARFAAGHLPCQLGSLELAMVKGFFALVPSAPPAHLFELEAEIVRQFDGFRAPLSAAERERRLQTGLDEVEQAYLDQWGYPYVLDRFRFHMTLTRQVTEAESEALRPELIARFGKLLKPNLTIDSLCLFEQPEPGSDFLVRTIFPLAGERAS